MPLTLPYTFSDGPGNTASGVQVMSNLNAVNNGVAVATGTTFPTAGLVTGQDYYYLADATNGVVWHFKYRGASGSANKWEFVGGPPLWSRVLTQENLANTVTTWQDLATSGPDITVPLAGDYDVEWGSRVWINTASAQVEIAVALGAGATPAGTPMIAGIIATPAMMFAGSMANRMTSIAALQLLRVRYRFTTLAGTGSYAADRWMKVTPVRCI